MAARTPRGARHGHVRPIKPRTPCCRCLCSLAAARPPRRASGSASLGVVLLGDATESAALFALERGANSAATDVTSRRRGLEPSCGHHRVRLRPTCSRGARRSRAHRHGRRAAGPLVYPLGTARFSGRCCSLAPAAHQARARSGDVVGRAGDGLLVVRNSFTMLPKRKRAAPTPEYAASRRPALLRPAVWVCCPREQGGDDRDLSHRSRARRDRRRRPPVTRLARLLPRRTPPRSAAAPTSCRPAKGDPAEAPRGAPADRSRAAAPSSCRRTRTARRALLLRRLRPAGALPITEEGAGVKPKVAAVKVGHLVKARALPSRKMKLLYSTVGAAHKRRGGVRTAPCLRLQGVGAASSEYALACMRGGLPRAL